MSVQITSVFLRRCIDLGLQNEHLLPVVNLMDRYRDGPEMIEAVMVGLENGGRQAEAADFLKTFAEKMMESWAAREPANDRTTRMSSNQRRSAYERLAERDGEWCAQCECEAATIWRRMGTFSTEDGFDYTKVHPTTNLEVDHKTPIWAGGSNGLENLWLLCVGCHKAKTALEAGQRRRA